VVPALQHAVDALRHVMHRVLHVEREANGQSPNPRTDNVTLLIGSA